MDKKISCAIIGYGFAGATIHHQLLKTLPEYDVKMIVSSKPGFTSDIGDLFKDQSIDLVVIASPNHTHFDYALKSLQSGKHVVVDKPSVLNTQEFDQIVAEAAKQKKVFSVFQNRRWDSDFLTVKKLISEGTLGEVKYLESHFDRFRPKVQDRWREKDVPGAGLLYDVAPHVVDQSLVLFGRPDWVWADVANQRPGAEVDDYFHLVLGYGTTRVVLHASMLSGVSPFRFMVQGTKATYLEVGLDSQEGLLRKNIGPMGAEWGKEPESTWGFLSAGEGNTLVKSEKGCYEEYYKQLARQILQGGKPPIEINYARDTIEIIEKALAVKGCFELGSK